MLRCDSMVRRYNSRDSLIAANGAMQLDVVVCKDRSLHRAAHPMAVKRDILVAMNARDKQLYSRIL
jgi:hypothetical protein